MTTYSDNTKTLEQASDQQTPPKPSRSQSSTLSTSKPSKDPNLPTLQSLLPFSPSRVADETQDREALRHALIEHLKPTNIIEERAIDILTGLSWELDALERCRMVALEFARRDALVELLVGRLHEAHATVHAMYKGDQAAYDQVENALQRFGISSEAIEAQARLLSLDTLDRLNRLAAQTQIRIDLLLRQIERRRSILMVGRHSAMKASQTSAKFIDSGEEAA